jgi:hypothetical protein
MKLSGIYFIGVKPSFVIASPGFRSEKGNKKPFAPFAPWPAQPVQLNHSASEPAGQFAANHSDSYLMPPQHI